MDRRRAAGALLALAACIASSAAAPTASNQTALDLYDETAEGCYYNFQHYGEGDRIMTNEPCLNCTCHNRMLMCYLRVCPFTKAIGQDCTVEKRADQCCPIVTCPDVPVDLLTSTSTSPPAEYGGTGVGRVDKYGCTINGKYFSEGAKVPSTPGKPCEHCYCIRNMTTCVMQECTLHVDGCTPIYHKDVCCPVRYYCDHPEDEMPLLDDMTTTVRPTPGFLLTTAAPTEPPTTVLPARRDCIEDDQLYPDGALIKTDKPCEHCYCMKGDIVCVVQECGTPMENEGKNCSSLPPREGQCCPDTYICEGDEISTEVPIKELVFKEPVTTIEPPRRASVEGSGYRNEPDEIPYTEIPTFATEIEGSGEEELVEKPDTESTEKDLFNKFGTTEEAEFIPLTTLASISEQDQTATTEPDKGLNTVPSGTLEEESTESVLQEKTTLKTRQDEQSTILSFTPEKEKSSQPSLEITTPLYETKVTGFSIVEEKPTESIVGLDKQSDTTSDKETTPKEDDQTEPSVFEETETTISGKPEDETLSTNEPTTTEVAKATDLPLENVHVGIPSEGNQELLGASIAPTTLSEETKTTVMPLIKEEGEIHPPVDEKQTTVSPLIEEEGEKLLPTAERKTTVSIPMEEDEILPPVDETKTTILPLLEEDETFAPDSRRTTLDLDTGTTPRVEDKTESSVSEYTTPVDKLKITEPIINEQNTVPVGAEEYQSTLAPALEITTMHEELKASDLHTMAEKESIPAKPLEKESSEQPISEITTTSNNIIDISEVIPTTDISKEQVPVITTESIFKKDEKLTPTESGDKELSTKATVDVAKETVEPSDKTTSTEKALTSKQEETEIKLTTVQVPEQQEERETTTESIMELSTFAHVSETEISSTLNPESEAATTATVPEKMDLPQSTTINPADNEIAEIPAPGRIPGEGDCLLEGTTYENDSIVPSTNKCHSGCKCVSSIIKCDPIICSPPPEDMDNCQPRYDTPEACCPTYVCDHGMETIPPQSQSHITGTETPTLPTIECLGIDCESNYDKATVKPSQTPEKIDSDCGGSGCDQALPSPAQPCTEDQCEVLQQPKVPEKPQEMPSTGISQSCANPNDCKEITIPVSCEGNSCTTGQDIPCDKESGCITKPDEVLVQETPQVCTSEEECKQVKIPLPESVACEGESCTSVQEDCSSGECKIIDVAPKPSQQGGECSNGNDCTKPDQAVECENGKCVQKEDDTTETVCSGDVCMQQQPILPTGSINTESPTNENVTTGQPILEEKTEPTSTKLPTTLSEGAISVEPTVASEQDKKTKEPESPILDEEDRVTNLPVENVSSLLPEATSMQPVSEFTEQVVTEVSPEVGKTSQKPDTEVLQESSTEAISILETEIPDSLVTEKSPHNELEVTPIKDKTENPKEITESYDIRTDKPKESVENVTELPVQMHDETQPTDISESSTPKWEESTKEPEVAVKEQEPITVSTETSVTETEKETIKPGEEPEKPPTESRMPDSVTVSLSQETTKLPEASETGIKVTESLETEYPEMSTSSGEFVTKSVLSTKSPTFDKTEITTSSYERETISTVYVTEYQKEITKIPNEDTEMSTKDEDETTPRITDITQRETKHPLFEEKYTTTEIPVKATVLPEYAPEENIPLEEVPEREVITTETPERSEIATPVPHADYDQSGITDIDVKEKVTTMPEITIFEKETESPLSHVTELSHPENTIASIVTESDDMPSMAPSKEQDYDITSTLAPKLDVINQAASQSSTETTELPQQVTTEEKIPVESVTEQTQEIITEITSSTVTKPPTTDSEDFIGQEPITKVSTKTESPEILEKITILPLEPSTIGENIEEVTESREPTISEEHEISTNVSESPQSTVQDSEAPDVIQEIITEKPELYVTIPTHMDKPTESLEEVEKAQTTKKPILDIEKEDNAVTTENMLPVIVTESQDLPEQVPEKKVTTETPVSDEEKMETSEEFITKQTFTELPEVTMHTEKVHQEFTKTPQLVDIKTEQPSTEKSADLPTSIPELQSTKEHEIEKQDIPVTRTTEQPMEEAQTESLEVQQATATAHPESTNPEISETTTISTKNENEKHTEQPISLFTEMKPSTTTEIKDESLLEEERTETTPEKVSEITKSPVKISTTISVSEEDKQPEEPMQTSTPVVQHSETTPYLVELEEHTHKIDDEEPTVTPSDELTVSLPEKPSVTSSEESTESTFASSEKPTSISSEQPTVVPSDELTVSSSEEPNVIQSHETTVASIEESTISLLGEPTVSLPKEPTVITSEEQTVASSMKPNVALFEETTVSISEELTTTRSEMHATEQQVTESVTEKISSEEKNTEDETERPSDHQELAPLDTKEPHTTVSLEEKPEKPTESIAAVETTSEIVKPVDELVDKYGSPEVSEKEGALTTVKPVVEDELIISSPSIETEKPVTAEETEEMVTVKPQYVPAETTAPEEEFIPVTTKVTTAKPEEESPTELPHTSPEDKPNKPASTAAPEISKPDEMQPTEEVPTPEDESHFPPSGGYNQEPDYVEEDQAFGPGTCRYGGKVYVSAQQIPRDDPCDFCFCFRSDIICLQQSCPPPIHGCHEEPIQGFCCPRYECPVSMATTLNVTTTTTTTTTTLPPHFLPHAYKGAATRKGCHIKGHTYQVGEVVRASSGPCLHCTCGGDGQMKCDPKQCTPEPMLRQMIAAAVSAKRRR